MSGISLSLYFPHPAAANNKEIMDQEIMIPKKNNGRVTRQKMNEGTMKLLK